MDKTGAPGSGVAAFTPGANDESIFRNYPNLFAKQTRRGCLQECFGCEAKTEFRVATMENPNQDIFYALEESSCCIRTFCPIIRNFDMKLSLGQQAGGPPILDMHRDLKCAPGPCKCCCYQQLDVSSAVSGQPLGNITEQFYCCVPRYHIVRPDGSVEYKLQQPTCCGGMCVDCSAEGWCNCRIPFYVFDPTAASTVGEEKGRIVKVWKGLGTELLTDADNFEVEFPVDSDPASRARLLAAMFFINQLHFENKGGGGA